MATDCATHLVQTLMRLFCLVRTRGQNWLCLDKRFSLSRLFYLLFAASSFAQAGEGSALPSLSNGWSRWAIAAPADAGNWCCFGALADAPKTCDLDSERLNFGSISAGGKYGDTATKTRTMHIYANMLQGTLQRLRVFGAGCPVSAKTPIRLLDNIDTNASLAWLNMVSVGASMKETQILPALAMHEGAQLVLFSLAKHNAASGIRRQSWFWLSQINALNLEHEAMLALRLNTQKSAPNERNAIIFALSQLTAPRAGNALIAIVQDLKLDFAIRKEALFWLGQLEGDQGLDFLDRVLGAG